MKIVHVESGLGNQMLNYVEYLAIQHANPSDECYIDTIIYEISECNDVICQWNGYELENIFNIKTPNIKELFPESEWSSIIQEIHESRFWEKGWNYPPYIVKALNNHGLSIINKRGDFEKDGYDGYQPSRLRNLLTSFFKTRIGFFFKRYGRMLLADKLIEKELQKKPCFITTDKNIFMGQTLRFQVANSGIDVIDSKVREAFKFPDITDERNIKLMELLQNTESVAIHARRGDMLSRNGVYYKCGFFKRSVRYIKKHVDNPIFFFFCDPGSIEWCKQNEKVFDLDFTKDIVYFIDWNKGDQSFRDMQLMSMCKHNIFTNSSFGWWGAYLNSNPSKITCSPDIVLNSTHHF